MKSYLVVASHLLSIAHRHQCGERWPTYSTTDERFLFERRLRSGFACKGVASCRLFAPSFFWSSSLGPCSSNSCATSVLLSSSSIAGGNVRTPSTPSSRRSFSSSGLCANPNFSLASLSIYREHDRRRPFGVKVEESEVYKGFPLVGSGKIARQYPLGLAKGFTSRERCYS